MNAPLNLCASDEFTPPEVSPSFTCSSSPSTRPYSGPSSGRIPHLDVPHYLSPRMPLPYCPSTNRKWISTSWTKIIERGVSDALQISNLMIKLIGGRDVPYSPSFVLDLAADVDEHIRNVVDFVFLPGFNNPTVAVLFQAQQTWTG